MFQGSLIEVHEHLLKLRIVWQSLINLAGNTNKKSHFSEIPLICEANVTFNTCLAKLAIDLQVQRYIFVSTYSTSMDGKSFSPQTLYAATKYASENILEYFRINEGLKLGIIQLYDIYGPNHHPDRLISSLLKKIVTGEKIRLSEGMQEIAPLYIEDACDGILKAAKKISSESIFRFSLLGSEIFKVRDLPNLVSEALQMSWLPNQVEFTREYREREIMKVNPWYPPLVDWNPVYKFQDGIVASHKSRKKF